MDRQTNMMKLMFARNFANASTNEEAIYDLLRCCPSFCVGVKLGSLTLRVESRLRVFEKGNEVTGGGGVWLG